MAQLFFLHVHCILFNVINAELLLPSCAVSWNIWNCLNLGGDIQPWCHYLFHLFHVYFLNHVMKTLRCSLHIQQEPRTPTPYFFFFLVFFDLILFFFKYQLRNQGLLLEAHLNACHFPLVMQQGVSQNPRQSRAKWKTSPLVPGSRFLGENSIQLSLIIRNYLINSSCRRFLFVFFHGF